MTTRRRLRVAYGLFGIAIVLCGLTGFGHGDFIVSGVDLSLGWLGLTALAGGAAVKP